MNQNKIDAGIETLKAAPAISIAAGTTIMGWSLPDWASFFAIVYTVCLIIQMGYRFVEWASRKLDE